MRLSRSFRHPLLLLSLLLAPLANAQPDLISCRMPSLDIYLMPVLPALPGNEEEVVIPSVELFFDTTGQISAIGKVHPDSIVPEALVPTLRKMRFSPAQCFDEPVDGFSHHRFPTFFVHTASETGIEPSQPPFFRISFDAKIRRRFAYIAKYSANDWLRARLEINELGQVTEIDSGIPEVDEHLKTYFAFDPNQPAFKPAMSGDKPVPSTVTFYSAPGLWASASSGESEGTDSPHEKRPMPTWPSDLMLDAETICHVSLYSRPNGDVHGAYLHPDVPKALGRPLLTAIRSWAIEHSGFPYQVQVRLALLPETREIVEIEITQPTFKTPRPLRQNPPRHPRELKRQGVGGQVVVAFEIDQSGNVVGESLEAEASSHPLFTEAALEAVRKWRFKPATLDDTPVNTRVRIPIDFRLAR